MDDRCVQKAFCCAFAVRDRLDTCAAEREFGGKRIVRLFGLSKPVGPGMSRQRDERNAAGS